jgi:N-acetylglucosaminyldiphosphoundecaprenol N-acetyl-beta-D-mannosaminyltransferase
MKNTISLKNGRISRSGAEILDVFVDSTPAELLLKQIKNKLSRHQQFFIVTPNPEILVAAQRNEKLKIALKSADISIPDGAGLLFAAKLLGLPLRKRVPGRVFMELLIEEATKNKWKLYFVGSTDAVISRTLTVIKEMYPSAVCNGSSGPRLDIDALPINKREEKINEETIQKINAFAPDLLFIAFGCPKQEEWFSLHRKKLKVGGAMVVGGSLDVFSGYKKIPPHLFHSLGLEWLWRLIQEPNRFGRIMNAVIVFPLLVILKKVGNSLR